VQAVAATAVAVVALTFVPGGPAAGAGISTTTTSVASGQSFTIQVCVSSPGDGGYLVVKGPGTFSQDLFFGSVTGCSDVSVSTVGWAAGKYRINGFEFTTKGAKGLGSVNVTVT
jgi:hypothetical protein